MRAGNNF